MSIDQNYVSQLEDRVDHLEEENKKLRTLVDNGIIRLRDLPTFQKRSIFHPFRKTLNDTVEFGYCYMKADGYGTIRKWLRTSPKGLSNKIKTMQVGEEGRVYPAIKCCFNGLHYPMIDCDSNADYKKARKFFESMGVSYFEIESSSLRYWVIGDLGNLDHKNIFALLRDTEFGDKQHLNCSHKQGFTVMRAFKKDQSSDYPRVYSLDEDESGTTPNFKKFHEKLEEYFESEYPTYFGKQKNIGKGIKW